VCIYIIKYESILEGNETVIEGRLIRVVKHPNRYVLTIKGDEKLRATYYTEEDLKLELGMVLVLEGELSKPINNTVPNSFDYRSFLNNQRIYFLMKVDNVIIKKENTNFIYKVKNNLYHKLEGYQYTSDYLKTFILGDKSDMDSETYSIYQGNGVAHLFAISGMHINILSAIILFGLKRFNNKKNINLIIVTSVLILYASITNYSASILRSILFFSLISINKIFNLKIETKNILYLTVSLLIIYNSLIIFNLGFQYSAIITYGLIIIRKHYKKNYFYNLLITSFFALLFSLPITLLTFYEFNLLSIINNLIFVPLITFIIYPLSLLVLIFSFLEPMLYIFINIMEMINLYLDGITITRIVIPKVPIFFYLIYYLLLRIYVASNNKKYLIISIMLIFSFKLKYYIDPNTYIYFLDVGQGDSTLIYNNKEAILIDTGGVYGFDISSKTLSLIKSLGIPKIDLLLLTHGDADHMKDAPNIIKKHPVKNVMINGNDINELEMKLLEVFPNVIEHYQSTFDLTILREYIKEGNENYSSIISLFKIEGHNIIIMGDSPKEVELLLINDHNIKVDIIRLGHHGSRTSSDINFLKSIGARNAIISSGRNNMYNHPHKEVIENLEALSIKYYNTAEYGTIKYKFGRGNYTKITYPP